MRVFDKNSGKQARSAGEPYLPDFTFHSSVSSTPDVADKEKGKGAMEQYVAAKAMLAHAGVKL